MSMTLSGSNPPSAANGPIRRRVIVANPQGLHMRPASDFAKSARDFVSLVTLWHGDRRADGKSVLELLLLVATPGAELVLEVEGLDARLAIECLGPLLESDGINPCEY